MPQEHLGPKGWERFDERPEQIPKSDRLSQDPAQLRRDRPVSSRCRSHHDGATACIPPTPIIARDCCITAIGGLALTVDIPLIRLADGEPWPILMLRTGTTFLAALVIWAVWRALSPNAPSLIPGRLGARRRRCSTASARSPSSPPSTTPRPPIWSSSSPSPPCSPRCCPGYS